MIDKPYFNDSELYCIYEAVKRDKKVCEEMYNRLGNLEDERAEVIGEMDEILDKIDKYKNQNDVLTSAINKLLSSPVKD